MFNVRDLMVFSPSWFSFNYFNYIFYRLPPTSLCPNIRYDKLAGAFEGFQGFHVETPQQLESALKGSLSISDKPTIINLAIDPAADRKAQVKY